MALWLCKQEPGCYSYADLERDGRTTWDGVGNALARKHLRQMRAGDRVLFYATGKVKAVVALMRVVSDPTRDPESDDVNAVVVEMEPAGALPQPVSLARIKEDPALSDWELVRLPRLSVMPVTEAQWRRVVELGGMGR